MSVISMGLCLVLGSAVQTITVAVSIIGVQVALLQLAPVYLPYGRVELIAFVCEKELNTWHTAYSQTMVGVITVQHKRLELEPARLCSG